MSTGFFWKVAPLDPPNQTPITTFFIDDIQVVSGDSPPAGEGGMGGVSGDGAGGAP